MIGVLLMIAGIVAALYPWVYLLVTPEDHAPWVDRWYGPYFPFFMGSLFGLGVVCAVSGLGLLIG